MRKLTRKINKREREKEENNDFSEREINGRRQRGAEMEKNEGGRESEGSKDKETK